ncbi:E3 ubiquitin-protein ligase XIAP-like [Dreissena polymorpha]|uniref:RING-type domain-containing protein n=1 Tax=Dreissena polymorpha TaxID=45954 RepID=A0A9D4HXL5_DREPO|nr:E3 ubiquitin-protein ligase XIAP-like [Dreissena polymorpha]XP_052240072.1 E3 ubiquitin-protein ligase XIAP-like [Dreissena polymorpha]XP_052240073.1 E3 ubiquitin-protein ligase XIAP-like [Dreissena polymorpha]KAH3736537.1 hypothetical protein DPMN_043108 [Dreissena polymorpha]
MMSSTNSNSAEQHSETEPENCVVCAIKLGPQLNNTVHNKNTPRERRRYAITLLRTIANLQANSEWSELRVYCRHRSIYLIAKAKWQEHWFKNVKRLPATFMGYIDTSGELKICGKSRDNSQDIQSAFASLDSFIKPENVFYIKYDDLNKPISVPDCKSKASPEYSDNISVCDCKGKAFLEYSDTIALSDCKGKVFLDYSDTNFFDCFKTHAGSTLNVCPTNPPEHNVPAQEAEQIEQESHSVQAEDESDTLSSIAPSSSTRDFPSEHRDLSSSNHRHLILHPNNHAYLSFGYNNGDGNFRFDGQESYRQTVRNADGVSNGELLPNCQHEHDDITPHNDSFRQGNNTLQNPEPNYPTAKYPNFRHEEVRRQSFSTWPRTRPSAHDFAPRGFFYTGIGDLVRCFCCGIGLKDFSDTDNSLMEHAKHSRNCAFLLELFGSREQLQRYTQSVATQEPEEIRRQQRQQYNNLQGLNVNGYRARHERLRSLQARLDTFTNWPSHLAQRPYQLAEAGLYYTGVDDHCRCFACDGGLRKWEPGDDPWIEHCRWFPACPHAIATKGRDFIDLIQLSADQAADHNASEPQEEIASPMARISIEDSVVQRITDRYDTMLNGSMGFSHEDIKQAVLEIVQQGSTSPNVEDIVTQIEIITERNANLQEFRTSQNVEQTEDGLLEENNRLKRILVCIICKTNQVNILFLPCTHHKVCLECSRDIHSCPVCKRTIKDKIRTYML